MASVPATSAPSIQRLTADELLGVEKTHACVETAVDWLRATINSRIQNRATGRVVIEIITDGGCARRMRATQEDNFDEEDF